MGQSRVFAVRAGQHGPVQADAACTLAGQQLSADASMFTGWQGA